MYFKLTSFAGFLPWDFEILWTDILKFANAGGYTKLLVDYSQNEGGFVINAFISAMAFHPEVEIDWFLDKFDITYNDAMQEWLDTGIPLLEVVADEYSALSAEVCSPLSLRVWMCPGKASHV